MTRERNRWLTSFALLIYASLFAPIVVLILFSFNLSRRNFVWTGFTFDWYPKLFANRDLLDAVGVTMEVALIAVIGSTVIGSLLGLGLARLRFRVTVNTDNRLMSDTTMSQEMQRLVEAFGYGWSDLQRFTINAMKSAFISFDERLAIIDDVIKPRYAVLIG